MRFDADEIRLALVRQWKVIDRAIPTIDLDRPSRVDGWRNREVVAHLSLQPVLLVRFISKQSSQAPHVSLESNLAGTHSLATVIDAAARDAAVDSYTFGKNLLAALGVVEHWSVSLGLFWGEGTGDRSLADLAERTRPRGHCDRAPILRPV